MLHRFLLVALPCAALAGSASAQNLTTELFAQGFASPVDLQHAPGDPDRIFVVEQGGTIDVLVNGVQAGTFLNISGPVQSGGEQGLLGLAFHPDYDTNGRFFVNYTRAGGDTVVEEYSVSADPNVANSAPVQTIAVIGQDFSNHNGGCLQFGPDGMLYVGMGDGGSANDPNNRAQDGDELLGKMLRFDVDVPSPFIPADNPWVGAGDGIRDEIWHFGLRNPWRFSFDRANGEMYIGDVGQGAREEVSWQPAGMGGLNYGWRCMEGRRCTGLTGCTCNSPSLELPITQYNHNGGRCSITGGYVYRGAAIPALQGTYFYADFCSNQIWSLRWDGNTGTLSEELERTAELDPPNGNITSITSFGEDFHGELYILEIGGQIWKIVEDCGDFTNYCQALPNSTGSPSSIGGIGSGSIADNDFTLSCNGLPFQSMGIFFFGPDQTLFASGQGNVCVVGNPSVPAIRIPSVLQADIFGGVFYDVDFNDPTFGSGPGAILSGVQVNFQYWHRDTDGMGGATWNYSDGLSVTFCP